MRPPPVLAILLGAPMKPTQQRTEEGGEKRVWLNPRRLSVYEFSQVCPDGFRGLSSGIPKGFVPYVLELELKKAKAALRKIAKARKIEGLGWSLGTGTEISPKNEPATIARAALRDLGEGQ